MNDFKWSSFLSGFFSLAESTTISMPQQKILIDVVFTEKWIGFDFYGLHENFDQLNSFQQAKERILHFSGFFFQVKEVLPYLFQLKPNQIQFSAEIF